MISYACQHGNNCLMAYLEVLQIKRPQVGLFNAAQCAALSGDRIPHRSLPLMQAAQAFMLQQDCMTLSRPKDVSGRFLSCGLTQTGRVGHARSSCACDAQQGRAEMQSFFDTNRRAHAMHPRTSLQPLTRKLHTWQASWMRARMSLPE